ncbi:MAG TPA: hypothetical protein VMR02_16005 [Terracidiphilus sp.]|jgi:hypothetical protein|nr:hypothetical protein [Terracidiphilus sp.]
MAMTQTLAAMSWLRMGGLHSARDGGFGTFLVGVVLVGVVAWIVVRRDRDVA